MPKNRINSVKIRRSKVVALLLVAVLTVSCFAGCGLFKEKTPEEQEAERLASVLAEENSTGLKRLDSPNFTDYEKPMQTFVEGIKENDADKICDALGSPAVLSDDDIYGWLLNYGYDYILDADVSELKIKSEKSNATATITLYKPEDDTTSSSAGQSFATQYEDGRWILVPPSGVTLNYSFKAQSRDVSCGDVSLKDYALSTNSNGEWMFQIPRIIKIDDYSGFKITTQAGTFDAMVIVNSYSNELIAEMSSEQKTEFLTKAQELLQSAFDKLKAGTTQSELATVMVSEAIISDCFPKSDATKKTLAEKFATVEKIELFEGTVSGQYPDAYIFRVYKDNGIQFDAKVKLTTTDGECRKLATVTLQLINDEWKVSGVVCKDGSNLFTEFSIFDPEW